LDYVVRKVKKSGDGILNKINELDRKRVHRRKRENMKRQKFRWLERHQDLRQKVSKLESDISSCKEVLSFVTGNDDCDQDLLRAKENIEGQVIGLRSLLRHVKNDPSRLTQPFYDLLSEVLVSHRDLQDELDCSESILSVEITEARKRIRKALRTNAAENSTRALYSSERVEQLIDSIRVNPDRDHVLVEQVLVNFEVCSFSTFGRFSLSLSLSLSLLLHIILIIHKVYAHTHTQKQKTDTFNFIQLKN
jgi:hypothetical protein